MFITSNMLEVVPTGRPGQYGSYDNDDGGEELAKRVENFGHPIGKGMYSSMILVDGSPTLCVQDDPDVPPILICKIRMGQELKVRCIAKKVRPVVSSLLVDHPPTT